MSALAKRLVRLLREQLPDLPEGDWKIRRTRAGAIQRSHGAFSFFLNWRGDKANVEAMKYSGILGSQYPASYLVKVGIGGFSIRYGDIHINPKEGEA